MIVKQKGKQNIKTPKAQASESSEFKELLGKYGHQIRPSFLAARNTKAKKQVKATSSLEKLESNIKAKMASYLPTGDLGHLCETHRCFHTQFTKKMAEQKQVREVILPHIFNNTRNIDLLFNGNDALHPKVLLTKTSYHEGYFSKKLNQFVCFRHWRSVSPLQAAYICGDGSFLGRKLLAYITALPFDKAEPLLAEARQQLQELLNRTGVNIEKTSLNNIVMAKSAAATAINNNDTKENKEKAELCLADNAEFLAPIKQLIEAYNAYISQYSSLASQGKWFEIDQLWEQVGECQKKLSQYVKEEFLNPFRFNLWPENNTDCRQVVDYGDNLAFQKLDRLGINGLGLFTVTLPINGGISRHCCCRSAASSTSRDFLRFVQLDLKDISQFCKLGEADLRETIDCLKTLKSARELVANVTRMNCNTIT